MRYKPMPTKGDINPETALIQGAYSLDAAAEVAERNNDVEGLLNVAAMWVKLSQDFDAFASGALPTEENSRSNIAVGFQRNDIQVDKENEDAGIE
jgi:hypothetical protein